MISNKHWIVSLLGFLGFMGFDEPLFFLFFLFFGGFRYYWWQKIGSETDERLLENKNTAAAKAFKITFIISIVTTILIGLFINDSLLLYKIQLAILSLSFAIGINLWAYYTYQLEFGEE
ncbi:DUF3796 domain-containing protein [Macrococcoides canis]|uniref:DUF3796 domain-containing protein n=1 Tax=Macrococcoides canis TaxID=1855823 RepID=UPI001F3B49FD|nr:DUF3796 domain-containing protein [Macrococcus canis]UJS27477.1 DUF3796 domain-containing protein [Macrococcus canis]UTG99793.1 DUF3796 domain-containing protein [Macrococcus canis]